ncbi:MAG: UDP-N-acetyl-D-glucosamine dehydrogenase, partial [Candidatus Marinimicrobia bacterium]|nr:UDP-N-acetyl-D-glucosamine dehydrogenase [Candidatus Neomarinimicrobiota bacterium]
MDRINNLKLNIQNRDACIAVIGLGYVGLPLVIRFSEEGFKTIGFDIDEDKVKKLNAGETYIKHIPEEKIAAVVKNGFKATSDFSQISNVDAIIICVPTPLGIHNEPDLSYIKNTLSSIKPYLKESQLLVLESTTYPGTTEEEIIPFIQTIKNSSLLPTRRKGRQAKSSIENQKFTIGVNFYVGYSPEREDPGNKNYTTKTIPKVVSGYTKNCLELTKTLYDQIVDQTVPVSSPRVAEMTKILENIHRAV